MHRHLPHIISPNTYRCNKLFSSVEACHRGKLASKGENFKCNNSW